LPACTASAASSASSPAAQVVLPLSTMWISRPGICSAASLADWMVPESWWAMWMLTMGSPSGIRE
jgi:hypothetical protein